MIHTWSFFFTIVGFALTLRLLFYPLLPDEQQSAAARRARRVPFQSVPLIHVSCVGTNSHLQVRHSHKEEQNKILFRLQQENVPVVVRGLTEVNSWRALHTWSDNYLSEKVEIPPRGIHQNVRTSPSAM